MIIYQLLRALIVGDEQINDHTNGKSKRCWGGNSFGLCYDTADICQESPCKTTKTVGIQTISIQDNIQTKHSIRPLKQKVWELSLLEC